MKCVHKETQDRVTKKASEASKPDDQPKTIHEDFPSFLQPSFLQISGNTS